MTRRGPAKAIALALVLLVVACGDDDDGGEDASPTTVDEATTTDAPVSGALDGTLVTSLNDEYGTGPKKVAPGMARVAWYRGDDTYFAVYSGNLDSLGPLCPGNSLGVPTTQTFEYVTNAPTEDGGCEGIRTERGQMRVCDLAWMYKTTIPVDSEGLLVASISAPGTDAGVQGGAAIQASVIADIDPDADTYTVEPGMIAGDPPELDCSG